MTYAIARTRGDCVDFVDKSGGWTFDANKARTFFNRSEAALAGRERLVGLVGRRLFAVDIPIDCCKLPSGHYDITGPALTHLRPIRGS